VTNIAVRYVFLGMAEAPVVQLAAGARFGVLENLSLA